MSVAAAKGRLDRGGGEPATGYISKTDLQTSYDDLNDAITSSTGHNVMDYGAVGDDTTDDTAAIQAAIDAAIAAGEPVIIPAATFKITDDLTVTGAVTITGRGTLRQVTTSKNALTITGSDVTVEGITLQGRHSTATYAANEAAIDATGTSAASPLRRLTVRNVTITKWGIYGVYLKYVTTFAVTGCDLTVLGHCGVLTLSCIDGLVADNRIDDVTTDPGGGGYGIALTRDETDNLVNQPHSADIVVRGNRISGIPDWEGIDTHAGQRIVIADNIVTGCLIGISINPGDNASNDNEWAPKDITVTGNVIDSQVTDGSAQAGIVFAGAYDTGATVDYATGAIVGNVIKRHGTESNSIGGAMYLRDTRGLVVSGNTFEEPGPFGINLYHDNLGFAVTGNTCIDAWSDSVTVPSAVATRGDNNEGLVVGNTMRAGTKSATYVNEAMWYEGSGGDADINYALNEPSDVYNVMARHTVTGSKASGAALTSLLAALVAAGIITDTTSA